MYIKALITLIMIAFVFPAQSTQFFATQFNKNGKSYQNQLAELDPETGSKLKEIKLADSLRAPMNKLALPESPYLFMYGLTDKKRAKLQIINKANLDDVKTVNLEPLNDRVMAAYQLYQFYQISADHKYLYLHTGKKKTQALTIIDVANGSVLHKIPISKHKNQVSVSQDGQYILVNDISRDELILINTTDFSQALTSKLGESRAYGTIHNDHLYLTKTKGKDRSKTHWVQAINLKTQIKTNFTERSSSPPVFTVSPETNQLFTLLMSDRDKVANVYQLNGIEATKLASVELRIKPKELSVDERFNRLIIFGKGKLATINLLNPSDNALTKLPFDTADHLFNRSGDLLYLREGSGSEVAVVDVNSGQLIERSGTGRKGVKFGQFMGTLALGAITAGATGYMSTVVIYSSTGMTLNEKQDKLYVINSKTNDVTLFNASDLTGRDAIATGGGTFLVHQGAGETAPLWVFSGKRINLINDAKFELQQEIEYEQMVGLDMINNHFIIKTTDQMVTYDMNTGQITKQWPLFEASMIWSEGP